MLEPRRSVVVLALLASLLEKLEANAEDQQAQLRVRKWKRPWATHLQIRLREG